MTFMLKPQICLRCGLAYQPASGRQKYCGHRKVRDTCAWLAAQDAIEKARVVRAALAALPRICQRCGLTYQPTARGQKYCGKQKVRGTCSWHVAQDITKKWMADNPDKMQEYRGKWWSNLTADPKRYQKYLVRCRRKDLKRQGMTQERYDAKLATQDGLCATCRLPHGRSLCGRSKDLAIDHDHATGQLRGLLCDDCNIGLGLFHDDPQRLMNAALYVLHYKELGGHPLPEMVATQERIASLPGLSQRSMQRD